MCHSIIKYLTYSSLDNLPPSIAVAPVLFSASSCAWRVLSRRIIARGCEVSIVADIADVGQDGVGDYYN